MTTSCLKNYNSFITQALVNPATLEFSNLGLLQDQKFIQFLEQQQIFSLVIDRILQQFPDFACSDNLDMLHKKHAAFNHLLSEESEKLVAALSKNNIAVIELKGSKLSTELYQNPGLRDSGDIDLLIEWEDFSKAVKILSKFKYELVQKLSYWQRELDHLTNHSVELRNMQTGISLDLHWRLAERYYASQSFTKDFWDAAQIKKSSEGLNYKTNPKYDFVFLCLQAFKEHFASISSLNDLYVFKKIHHIDPQIIIKLADRYDLGLIVASAMKYADNLFENNKYIESKFTIEIDWLLSSRKKITSYFEIIFFRYFMPFASDFNLRLPDFLLPLYFPIKWFRLIFKALRSFKAFITKSNS